MKAEDMFAEYKLKGYTQEEVKQLWPQARGELLGFANALERENAAITASQMRLAVWLAGKQFSAI